MPGSFDERMAELEAMVGHGTIEASVEVDQIYAHYIHEGLSYSGVGLNDREGNEIHIATGTLTFHRGGQAKYLEVPWEAAGPDFAERMARGLLNPNGLHSGAEAFARDGVKMVKDHAPVDYDNLRRSGHPKVVDNGETVFDEPPEVPRLSEEELKAERAER